jgi:hypothetical protein
MLTCREVAQRIPGQVEQLVGAYFNALSISSWDKQPMDFICLSIWAGGSGHGKSLILAINVPAAGISGAYILVFTLKKRLIVSSRLPEPGTVASPLP